MVTEARGGDIDYSGLARFKPIGPISPNWVLNSAQGSIESSTLIGAPRSLGLHAHGGALCMGLPAHEDSTPLGTPRPWGLPANGGSPPMGAPHSMGAPRPGALHTHGDSTPRGTPDLWVLPAHGDS